MRVALAVALLLASPTTSRGTLYDFEWRSAAMVSRYEGGDTVTTRAEIVGHGRLRLTALRDGRLHFAFWSPEGNGEGDIVGDRVEWAAFPTPLDVGTPAAPPHLTIGTFKPVGDPRHPHSFELTWAEGFICRTSPSVCGNVTAWARELTSHATRTTRTE